MKNRIEVTCPHCEATQIEPSLAISTFCRSCAQHFKIARKAEKKRFGFLQPRLSDEPFAVPEKRITPHALKTRPLPQRDPDPETVETGLPSPPPAVPSPASGTAAPPSQDGPASTPRPEPRETHILPLSLTEILSRGSGRQVLCFECPEIHQVPADASSTLCPACGTYINLVKIDIREHRSQRIQTRGDVTIHKNASHIGAELRCHDLTIHGEVTGSVDASGTVTFKHSCRLQGDVRCGKLVVDKKVSVEFKKLVLVGGGAEISGNVTGDIECGGTVKLNKNACLDGSLRAAGIAVDPGAELLAETEIVRRG